MPTPRRECGKIKQRAELKEKVKDIRKGAWGQNGQFKEMAA